MPVANGIAILGGTFDPVHFGHLRSALEVCETLNLQSVRLVPAGIPPHRELPRTTPEQRLAMLQLATADEPGLEIDDRELRRAGPSYTVDTLASIRSEVGPDVPLTTIIGFDAYCLLYEWHEWQQITDMGHIAVLERPGVADDALNDVMRAFTRQHLVESVACLAKRASGGICRLQLTQMDISASAVRGAVAAGRSPAFLTPAPVVEYIRANKLYGAQV